jgi:hypothetical protein
LPAFGRPITAILLRRLAHRNGRLAVAPGAAPDTVGHLVEQVADAQSVLRGHLEHRLDAQFVELHRRLARLLRVYLVDHGEDRRAGGTQARDDVEIAGDDPLLGVEHEDEQVGVLDRLLPFLRNHLMQRVLSSAEHSAGVQQREGAVVPLHGLRDQIARRPGDWRDDGASGPRDPVEQRGLADIGPADEHDKGQRAGHWDEIVARGHARGREVGPPL